MATAGWLASGDPLSPVLGLAIIHMAFLPLPPKKISRVFPHLFPPHPESDTCLP